MTVFTKADSEVLVDPIDWTNVRPIYRKLQDDFYLITDPFGINLSERDNLFLSHLIGAIDSIDRILDNLPDKLERAGFAWSLLRYLEGNSDHIESDAITDELCWRMKNLRHIIVIRGVREEFCETAARIFDCTESKRWAKERKLLIRFLKEEWRLAGHLTVLVMRHASNSSFERFFYLCCEMMFAIDLIRDAKTDYANDEISIKPTIGLYLVLFFDFVVRLPKLLSRFPKRSNLVKYAAGFLYDVYVRGKE